MQKYKICLLASIIGTTPAMAALQALGNNELSRVAGAEGITIGVKGEFSADVAYKNDTDINSLSYIVLANNGGDFVVPDVKIDIDTIGATAQTDRALKISLPSKITGKRFNLGDLVLSPTPVPARISNSNQIDTSAIDINQIKDGNAILKGFADAPKSQTFQAVLTADNYRFAADGNQGKVGFDNDRFNPDLGVNELELQIQDVGGKLNQATGNVEIHNNGAANLQISHWHKFGTANDKIDTTLLTDAKNRRAAYAPTDAGNNHQEELYKTNLTALSNTWVSNNTVAVGSNDYFFIKGMEAALAKNGNKAMDIACTFATTGCNFKQWSLVAYRTGMDAGAAEEKIYSCTKEGDCNLGSDKSGASTIAGIGNGVVKYRINLTSRIDPIDSDKVIVKTTCSDTGASNATCAAGQQARYEANILNNGGSTPYAYSNGEDSSFTGSAGACFKKGLTGNMECEARPIVEGLSWYIKNDHYKVKDAANTSAKAYAVSADEYKTLSAGAQLAHDPRVIFTVDKQTEVRLMAINRNCSRWCGNDFDSDYKVPKQPTTSPPDKRSPRPAYRQTAIAPAVVLLDAQGRVIAYDTASGGEALKLEKDGLASNAQYDIYKQAENSDTQSLRRKTKVHPSKADDHGFFPMGLMEVTIGDPYYKRIKNRVLSTMSITASKEALKPMTKEAAIQNWSASNQNISFGLGGSAKIFAH